jgi:hypothetical protein
MRESSHASAGVQDLRMRRTPLVAGVQDLRTFASQHRRGCASPGDYDVRGKGCSNFFIDDSYRPQCSTSRNGPGAQDVSSPESSRRESSRVSARVQDFRMHGAALGAGVQDLRTAFGSPDFRGNGYGRSVCVMMRVTHITTTLTTVSERLLPTRTKYSNRKVQAECNRNRPAQGRVR